MNQKNALIDGDVWVKCSCGSKIIVLEKNLNWERSKKIIYCSKCQRKFTWKQYRMGQEHKQFRGTGGRIGEWWLTEPDVAHGLSNRVNRKGDK